MNDIEILKNEIERVELPLVNYSSGVIKFDLADFKNGIKELEQRVKEQNLSVKNVDEFYKLRAKLNKFSKQINDEKKRVKSEYNKPYIEFENQVKECLNMIDNASGYVDEQLKTYEAQQQEILRSEYLELWKSFEKDDVVPFERIENQKKWYLKSTSKKDVYLELKSLNDRIDREIDILKSSIQNVDELTEVMTNYYCSLDLGKELGEYTKWKNTIKAKEVIIEKEPEIAPQPVLEEPLKIIPSKDKKAVETKFEAQNQEKQVQAIISFVGNENIVEMLLEDLENYGATKINYRVNKL